MQLLHELALLFETIGRRLVLPTCKVNLFTFHIEDFFNSKLHFGHQFEIKTKELRSKGLLSYGEEQYLTLRCHNLYLVLSKQLKQRLPENLENLDNFLKMSFNFNVFKSFKCPKIFSANKISWCFR